MNKKLRRWRKRIVIALVLFAMIFALTELLPLSNWLGGERNAIYVEFALYLIPYAIAGYDVLLKAVRNIKNGQLFDENFLIAVATIGAFSLIFFPDSGPHMAEGAAVMLFYQVGELFQQYAVGKSRKSIAAMMDIAPDFAERSKHKRRFGADRPRQRCRWQRDCRKARRACAYRWRRCGRLFSA